MFFTKHNQRSRTHIIRERLFDFALIKFIPRSVILLIFVLHFASVACLYSSANASFFPWTIKQFGYFLLFIPIFILVVCVNNETLTSRSSIFFALSLMFVLFATFVGRKTMGASRWIDLGIVKIQPSEVLKVAFVLFLAN